MPSGAKKRKAAKKKMKKVAHNGNHITVNHSQENEEPRSHDERESDSGEVEREEEDEKREIDGEGDTDREEVVRETISREENVVDVGMEVKPEVDVDDVVKMTPHGDPSVENGISSSEVAAEKEQPVVEEVEELRGQDYVLPVSVPYERVVKPAEYQPEMAAGAMGGTSVEEVSNVLEERISDVESVKQVVPLVEEVNLVAESAPVEILVSDVIDPELKENVNGVLQSLDEKDKVSSITTDFQPEKIEEAVTHVVADDSVKSSTIVGFPETENEDKVPKLESPGAQVFDISPAADVVKGLEPLERLKDEIGALAVDRSCQVDNIDGLKHNDHSHEQVCAPAVNEIRAVDYVESVKTTEQFEEVSAPSVDRSHGVDDVKDLKVHQQSEKEMGAPAVDTSSVRDGDKDMKIHEQSKQQMAPSAVDSSHVVEQVKGLEAHENLEGQPLISSAPRVVQRTSWMSCCGLLEVFSGSHR
ncbi:hypothetical protein Ancab_005564 [Ancistrocladus abbreviatus]